MITESYYCPLAGDAPDTSRPPTAVKYVGPGTVLYVIRVIPGPLTDEQAEHACVNERAVLWDRSSEGHVRLYGEL